MDDRPVKRRYDAEQRRRRAAERRTRVVDAARGLFGERGFARTTVAAVAAEAEERRAPHRVAAYLIDLARDFHGFYHRCRVVGEAPAVEAFRLDLCRATGATVRVGLGLIGEAPERM